MKYILLDLDGTLTNPKLGITKSIQYALKAFGIIEENLDNLNKYIGPPLWVSLKEFHGIKEEQIEEVVAKYREYFSVTGIYENEVYEGIADCLAKLKAADKKLILATSKPEIYAIKILEHFGLIEYFTDVCGATMDSTRSTKEAVIRYALDKNHITDLESAVMVGDRLHDMEGAKAVGIASIGVLYGFGSREELEEYQADSIAETVDELYEIIMRI
jgi:haloacid dehalogenase superfamily, subfamily IA, variant 1 with third motif having Dx(3-4)D or Dx(3-4)E